MKKSADILRLPVISISEGKQVGTVKDLVIDAAQGTVVALVVDDGSWYLGAKILPFNSITGLGESAVTVEATSNLIPVAAMPRLEQLMSAGVKVIGTRTLTRSGHMGGKVVEITIDETGRISACEVEENIGDRIQIPVQQIVTFGKDVLIISDSVDPSNRGPLGGRPMEGIVSRSAPVGAYTPPETAPAGASYSSVPPADEAAQLFEEKQRRYLLGKKVNRRISANDGSVIIEQGNEITEEILHRVREEDKMIELTMNLRL
ncbi:MAG: PRC-barrel domain-containing protein [Negativicutes bacterium]